MVKYPSEISGGMQKRVAIARALVNKPKYLFADEPNSGLDPQTAMVIDKLLHELTVEYNTTTIINTHRSEERRVGKEYKFWLSPFCCLTYYYVLYCVFDRHLF